MVLNVRASFSKPQHKKIRLNFCLVVVEGEEEEKRIYGIQKFFNERCYAFGKKPLYFFKTIFLEHPKKGF